MRTVNNPFAVVERQEIELKRHQLYAEMKNLITKNEAYDDSGIGHDFVTHYERQLPGIITAHANGHSFINSSPEENLQVVMEAIESGTALKAGLVAAALMLVFKIIRVVMNNPAFSNSGGGRGTVTATKDAIAKLNEQAERHNDQVKELKDMAQTIASNPLHREDDSKVYKEAVKAIKIVTVNDDGTSGKVEDLSKDPIKTLPVLKFRANPNNIAAFFAVVEADKQQFIFEYMDHLFDGINKLNLEAFIRNMDLLANVATTNNPKHVVETLNSERIAHLIGDLVTSLKVCLGIQSNANTASELKGELIHFDQVYKMISISYANAQNEPDFDAKLADLDMITQDVLMDLAGKSVIRETLEKAAVLNEKFASIVDNNPELAESDTYQRLQHISDSLDAVNGLLREGKVEGFDGAIARINEFRAIMDLLASRVLKLFAMFRKQTDSGFKFIEQTISDLEKFNDAIHNVIETAKTDEGA